MPQIDGATALKFLAGVESAMDAAGGGKYRAFNLVTELQRIGIGLVAVEVPPVAAAPQTNGAEE